MWLDLPTAPRSGRCLDDLASVDGRSLQSHGIMGCRGCRGCRGCHNPPRNESWKSIVGICWGIPYYNSNGNSKILVAKTMENQPPKWQSFYITGVGAQARLVTCQPERPASGKARRRISPYFWGKVQQCKSM